MAHLPRLPILLFVFLGVHVPAFHGTPLPPTYDGSICSESSRCGGVDIRYPFYLSNATRETANSMYYSCGYTDLKVSCQGEGQTAGTPNIRLGGDSYTVQDIFYNNQTIVLADSDVLSGGRCPAVRHNVTFDEVWLHNTNSYDNLTFFLGCYSEGGDPMPPGFDLYQIDCPGSSNPPAGGASYVFSPDGHDAPLEHELAAHCGEVVVVPVLRGSLAGSNQSALPREYGALLKQGFELAWNRATADSSCYPCEGSGGRCAYNQSRVFLGCLCSDGKVGNQDCRNSSASSTASPKKPVRCSCNSETSQREMIQT